MLRVSSVRSAGHWALLSTTDFCHVIQSSRAINLYWNWKWTCLKWLLESIFAIPGTFLKLRQVKYVNKRVKSYSFHQKHFSSLLILDPMNVLIWTLFLKMVKILLALFFWHFLEQNFNLISVQCIFFFFSSYIRWQRFAEENQTMKQINVIVNSQSPTWPGPLLTSFNISHFPQWLFQMLF